VADAVREFVVYSRRGCHLCEIMLEELEPLCRGRARIQVRDIDTREEWIKSFGKVVPVLYSGEEEICRFHLERQAVLDEMSRDESS
jgi:hypothetical protein